MNVCLYVRGAILISLFCCVSVFKLPITCIFGVDKCPGNPEDNYYKITNHVAPLVSFHTDHDDNCSITCAYTSGCWIASIDQGVCRLYPKDANVVRGGPTHMYVWSCCRDKQCCQQQRQRCRGYWVKRQWTVIEGVRIVESVELRNDISGCKELCLNSLVCSAINYKEAKVCELLAFNASYEVSKSFNQSVNSYQWHCCSPDNGGLPDECRSLSGKCRGHWYATDVQPSEAHRIVGEIDSTGVIDCMNACEKNPYCSRVYINQTDSMCLMMSGAAALDNGTQCSGYKWILRHGRTWYGYEWRCCDPDDDPLQPQDPNWPSRFGACVCLTGENETDTVTDTVEVAGDGCTKPLLHPTIKMTSELIAMWQPEELQVTMEGRAWNRLFNGEIYLWLSLSADQLTKCSTEHCHHYSPVIKPDSCPEIVPRASWFARPPKKPLDQFTATPSVVSISNTVCPRDGCYSDFTCGSYMRLMQTYPTLPKHSDDIPYNYLVGEDGRVYEGRGPNFVGAHTLGYNSISLGIAFIGWYEERTPTVKSLVAVRRLLKCLLRRGNLTKSYRVFGHRDLRPSDAPARFLYELMPNWGHYSDHPLPTGLQCDEIFARKMMIRYLVIGGVVTFCLLLISSSILYARIYSHARWCPLRRSHLRRVRPRLLASVGREDVLAHNINEMQSNCTIRAAHRMHVQPGRSTFVMLSEKGDCCDCPRFFNLLWARCEAVTACDFPARLLNASNQLVCRRHSVLLLTDSLFLIHAYDVDAIKTAIQIASHDRCLCSLKTFRMIVSEVPQVDKLLAFHPLNLLMHEREERQGTGLKFPNVAEFCRLAAQEEGGVEEKYADFIKEGLPNYDEAVALDLSAQSGLHVTSLLL